MVLLLFLLTPLYANDIIELDEVTTSYTMFMNGNHPLVTQNLPNKLLDKRIDLSVKTSIYDYLYWNNLVTSYTDSTTDTTTGQFRTISLETHLGIRIIKDLSLELYHRSEHLLDTTYPNHFPNEDGIRLNIHLYYRGNRSTMF